MTSPQNSLRSNSCGLETPFAAISIIGFSLCPELAASSELRSYGSGHRQHPDWFWLAVPG